MSKSNYSKMFQFLWTVHGLGDSPGISYLHAVFLSFFQFFNSILFTSKHMSIPFDQYI